MTNPPAWPYGVAPVARAGVFALDRVSHIRIMEGFSPLYRLDKLPINSLSSRYRHMVGRGFSVLHKVAGSLRLILMSAHTDNILAVFDSATPAEIHEGKTWYLAANALAWEIDPMRPWNGAGVIAALSPRLRWDKNAAYARLAYNLKGYAIDEVASYIPALGNSRTKALRMVNGEHVRDVLGNGLKTRAFWDNILNPHDSQAVTVDKHAFDIANGVRTGYSTVITDKAYREIAAEYVNAANIAGIAPLHMQAITWVAWRNANKGGR